MKPICQVSRCTAQLAVWAEFVIKEIRTFGCIPSPAPSRNAYLPYLPFFYATLRLYTFDSFLTVTCPFDKAEEIPIQRRWTRVHELQLNTKTGWDKLGGGNITYVTTFFTGLLLKTGKEVLPQNLIRKQWAVNCISNIMIIYDNHFLFRPANRRFVILFWI